jgi:hypothetical protein
MGYSRIAASMKMAVSWVATPCSLVEVYRHFRGACCFYHRGDGDEGSRYLRNFYFGAGTQKDSHLDTELVTV